MSRGEEEEENVAELKLGDDFINSKCLINGEVSFILDRLLEQIQQISKDVLHTMPQVFRKSLQCVKKFSRYNNPDAVRQVRDILSCYQFELAVIGNLCPETIEEALSMVSSLKDRGKRLGDDDIEKMLTNLTLVKKFE